MSVVFRGGDKLEAKLRELAAIANSTPKVRVGFLEGSEKAGGGTLYNAKGKAVGMAKMVSAPTLALWMEYGTGGGIPPRPFIRGMIDTYSPAWGEQIGRFMIAAKYDPALTMERMGLLLRNQLLVSFKDGPWEPNTAATISRKGGATQPLVHSGNLRNAIDYEVAL